jgi:galacturan 1,4-alpha-galacturonidase
LSFRKERNIPLERLLISLFWNILTLVCVMHSLLNEAPLSTPDIQSYIQFTNDTVYWQANSFKFGFQNVTTFFKLGGNDVNIYGGGTIDGNGQVWYDLYAANIYTLRPVLIGIDGLHNSILSDLVLRYSPQYYHFVANATNVVFDNINIAGHSISNNVAKNTDGWDTYRSSDIVIQNSVVNNGDGKYH